jgi:hypothetical protein
MGQAELKALAVVLPLLLVHGEHRRFALPWVVLVKHSDIAPVTRRGFLISRARLVAEAWAAGHFARAGLQLCRPFLPRGWSFP